MMEFFDDDESIVMSLGKEKAASRGKKLGMEAVQVYQLRTVARGQTPKNPVEMPKESPAVTAGSSPESRKEKSKPEPGTKENPILPNNKMQGTPDKPVETSIEITNRYSVAKVPATVYGSTAVHATDGGWTVSHVPTGNNITLNGSEGLNRKTAETVAKELAKLNLTGKSLSRSQRFAVEEVLMIHTRGYTKAAAKAETDRKQQVWGN